MTPLPRLPKSSTFALNAAGIHSLEDCATWSREEVGRLRGVGPKMLEILTTCVEEIGLAFDPHSPNRAEPVNVAMAVERMKNAPVIPDSPTDLPFIGGPARSALAAIDVHDLAGVANHTRKELLALHGFGPKAIRMLEPALAAKGLTFRDE